MDNMNNNTILDSATDQINHQQFLASEIRRTNKDNTLKHGPDRLSRCHCQHTMLWGITSLTGRQIRLCA